MTGEVPASMCDFFGGSLRSGLPSAPWGTHSYCSAEYWNSSSGPAHSPRLLRGSIETDCDHSRLQRTLVNEEHGPLPVWPVNREGADFASSHIALAAGECLIHRVLLLRPLRPLFGQQLGCVIDWHSGRSAPVAVGQEHHQVAPRIAPIDTANWEFGLEAVDVRSLAPERQKLGKDLCVENCGGHLDFGLARE